MDTCLTGASGAIAEWEGQSPNIPDACIYCGAYTDAAYHIDRS